MKSVKELLANLGAIFFQKRFYLRELNICARTLTMTRTNFGQNCIGIVYGGRRIMIRTNKQIHSLTVIFSNGFFFLERVASPYYFNLVPVEEKQTVNEEGRKNMNL